MLKPFLISPPFGNLIGHPKATRVMGSYTILPRPGRWRLVTQVRRHQDGWVNRVGLRNPGIARASFKPDRLYSVAGLVPGDWHRLLGALYGRATMVELNVGCPNAGQEPLSPAMAEQFRQAFPVCSIKVEPSNAGCELALQYGGLIHMGNSLPTPHGGYSGPANRPRDLVERLAKAGCVVIAGGGVRDWQDVVAYRNAGAQHVSLSSVWFSPIRALRLLSR